MERIFKILFFLLISAYSWVLFCDESIFGEGLKASKEAIAEILLIPISYTVKVNSTPDLTQTDPTANFPGGGVEYCGPVSVSNSLMWIIDNGFDNLKPDFQDRFEAQVELARLLGSEQYMNTNIVSGTGAYDLMNGVSKYIQDMGYQYKRLKFQGWRRVPSQFSTGIEIPELNWIKSGILGLSGVWLNVGWYKYDPLTNQYERIGGHWVTLVGYGVDDNGNENSNILIVHDPSPRAGMTLSHEYVQLEVIESGYLKGENPSVDRSAIGYYKLAGGMHVKSTADYGILDGVVILEMSTDPIPVDSITITSPNGGELLLIDSTHLITWTTDGTVGNVEIRYSADNGSSWDTISASTSNDGSYAWTVPAKVSSTCLVKISEASDGSPTDTSDSTFSIVSPTTPTITVTSPNGGETLAVGSSKNVTWTTLGTVGSVSIQYSTDNGNSWKTITTFTSNDGSYAWTVPSKVSSTCLVKISEASDGSPTDTSDSTFSIVSPTTPTITVTSPNGGEILMVGSSKNVTWTTHGTVGNVRIWFSTDNGSSWETITTSTTNDGTYSWSVPAKVSSTCIVKVCEASDGSPSDTSDAVFTISGYVFPEISLNHTSLNYGAIQGGSITGGQLLLIENIGGGTLNWKIKSDVSWVSTTPASGMGSGVSTVTVNPSGLAAGMYTGILSVTAADASNSPQTIVVTLTVKRASVDQGPFGEFATPQEGSTCSSSVPITGWALDDVEVDSVKIYNGGDYIGDAVFVEGARPDIEKIYSGYPKDYRAGWGYMLLSNFLPNGGNGTYTLHAHAVDSSGKVVLLGSKTIHIDNASAIKPFGAIDSPAQGGTVTGSTFTNYGWVLTPQPNKIPETGSTIFVYVDGVKLGTGNYNGYREDVATLFPGYANSNGAAAWFQFDTTNFSNGVHSIYWVATDNAGNTDGIGSRFFMVLNTGDYNSAWVVTDIRKRILPNIHWTEDGKLLPGIPIDYTPVGVIKGYRAEMEPQVTYPDEIGINTIEIVELECVEVWLNGLEYSSPIELDHWFGKRLDGDKLKPLPIGSTFNGGRGIFYWMPGPGFMGTYDLIFIEKNENTAKRIKIKILPKYTQAK